MGTLGKRGSSTIVASVLALLVVLAVFALAACGGSGTAASSSPSAAPTTAVPQAVITGLPAAPLPTPTVAGTLAFMKILKPSGGGNGDIYVVNTDGTGLKRLTNGPSWEDHPTWSPDGRRIAYAQWQGDNAAEGADIWVMNADGSGKVRLTTGTVRGVWPTWSPDGRHIAFVKEPQERIFVMNPDGSGRRAVGKGIKFLYATDHDSGGGLAWAPDGRILSMRSGEVYAVNLDGSGLEPVTTGADLGVFAMSPDGTQIVLENSIFELYVAPVQGAGTPLKLAQSVTFLMYDKWAETSWSPDGRTLAIASSGLQGMNGSRLYVINADGSGLSQVPGIESANDPAWRPE